ncbi:LacI family DNA-binding transcriptional regulator [Georgenia deserti]|uniref:LacI family DNA-binding transcriptional regulator n=1 Tax=Georgenia deserti TaxID=2093781 RepID=A0ABW4L3W5_9MICO
MSVKTPTVYDVAAQAGVSIATVSRVFRQPEAVREATRERVMAAVRELGYVPSASARGLAGRRTSVLGLLLPGHDDLEPGRSAPVRSGEVAFIDDRAAALTPTSPNLYFDELLRGVEVASWRAGYALTVTAGRGMSREMVLSDIAGRVDGLAVVARTLSDDLVSRTARRLPIVVLAGTGAGGVDHVEVDNRGGMRALSRHVLQVKPPGPVLYLEGPRQSPDAEARAAGFGEAVDGADEDVHRRPAEFTHEGGYAATADFLRVRRPGAVVAANDQSALGALDALRRVGVRVPTQCVVTGFDGIDAGRYANPSLTTVRQPMTALGERAVEVLLRRLGEPELPPCGLQLPVEVLLRDSCPPAD